jgi:hypothetical protein
LKKLSYNRTAERSIKVQAPVEKVRVMQRKWCKNTDLQINSNMDPLNSPIQYPG